MYTMVKRNRPRHLGPYPLEKIKRVDVPTTLIIEDEVKRVPKRADGFVRAAMGDFGAKQQENRLRSGGARAASQGLPHPLGGAIGETLRHLMKLHDGEVAAEKAPIPEDPEVLAQHIKSFCYFMNADAVGICEAKPYAWYSHVDDAVPIEPYHKYAIVLLIDQDYENSEATSGDDWGVGQQSGRAYMRGAEIGNIIASYIRNLGYPAKVQSAVKSDIMHLPLILWAGLGELSRIGEVIINPFLGPRFKSTVITTDMPLAIDKPIDFGLQDFCGKCNKCARECPVGAIPYGDKVMYNGYETWKPDVPNCTSYRVSNPRGTGCGRCLKMCPWNKATVLSHRIGRWLAIHWAWTRKLLVRLDDWLGYGNRNLVKKWWFDIQTTGDKLIPARQTSEKDNHPHKAPPDVHRLALYTVDMLPPAETTEPWPFNREEGIKTAQTMERPDQARHRIRATVREYSPAK